MPDLTMLAAACAAFVGTHFLLSHPLRAPLVARIGAKGFDAAYSLVALATFIWVVLAYRAVPDGALLWNAGDALWALASGLMLAGSVLLLGSFVRNPAMAMPGAESHAAGPVRGVFAITRHPMMWGIAIWGVVHILVWPTPEQLVLAGAMIVLAIGGAWGQDHKKARLMGAAWQGWAARTAFIPFAGQVSGRIAWRDAAALGGHALGGGAVVWLAASWAHGALGHTAAGLFRWL